MHVHTRPLGPSGSHWQRSVRTDGSHPAALQVAGGGRPLEPEVRAEMGARLGHDFSHVRVHDDGRAHDSAAAMRALAYTVGSDIVFRRGGYNPGTAEGKLTLAHELTHVIQQSQGTVDGTETAAGGRVSSPDDRFERAAAANAEQAVRAPVRPAPGNAVMAGVPAELPKAVE